MNIHLLIKDTMNINTRLCNVDLFAASLLFLSCKAKGVNVFMSSFLEECKMHPLQFRRTILGLLQVIKKNHFLNNMKKVDGCK